MNKEEMICKNCKYHYIEEISFDYPQSCCDKRKAVIEEWFNCNDFEYSDKYIEQLQQKNKQLKMINKEYERLNKENGRGFKITNVQECDIYELLSYKNYKDNWNELKEWIDSEIENQKHTTHWEVERKMQELEQGSDNQ